MSQYTTQYILHYSAIHVGTSAMLISLTWWKGSSSMFVEHTNIPTDIIQLERAGGELYHSTYILFAPVQDIMDSVADWLATLMDNYKVILVPFPHPNPL